MSTQDDCGISVNLTQVPTSNTPLHIVLWKGTEQPQPVKMDTSVIQPLLDRISVLESMVSGLLESQKASLWFPSCLRPTPTGIEVISRRESIGNESDIGTILSQIVRPSDEIRTVNIVPNPPVNPLSSPLADCNSEGNMDDIDLDADADADAEVDMQVEVDGDAEGDADGEAEVYADADAEGEGDGNEGVDAFADANAFADADADADADEDVEEVVEYKEIEWKGHTYYVDAINEVYEMDSDGDLIDTPIGVWRENTQKLVKYSSKATM